ncbi:DUF4200 domain-containing protein [Tenacibaculum halocynthiae]|uniref:hypothetical protein n=1 Tax=Tenacibaculum halocynthiae TaxID=1254437 RepID=UPI003893DD04
MKKRTLLIALIGMSFGLEAQITDTGSNVGIGITTPKSKLDIGTNYSNPSVYPNKITLWSGGENNYFGFGISNADLDYFSQHNHRFYTEYNGTPGSEKMVIKSNGNVGVGITNPDMKLSVYSDNKYVSRFHSNETSDLMTGIRIGRKISTGGYSYADLVNLSDGFGISAGYSGGNLPLSTQNTEHVAIYTNFSSRNVGIGTITPGAWKLAVNGKIRAKEIKVETGWSDFVFYDDYELPTLKEVENYIKEKGHLKDIPSAKIVEQNGIFLGEMDAKLLQKIEELTLYTIQQQKEIEELKLQNKMLLELQKRLDKLEKK